MRLPLPLLLLVLALTAGASAAQGEPDAVNRPLLGISGQADRFERQTGQDSQVRHIFLGWGQGSSWGSPFAQLFTGLKPIPMIHIGTGRGRARIEVITPAGIASGRGDAYLVALNQAIAAYGGQVFVRVMAEMNNPRNLYAPTRLNGTSKGPSHSAAAYKQAFRRAYLILHGGDVDATLRGLGQPPVGQELAVNPTSALTVIWNPIAGLDAQQPPARAGVLPGQRLCRHGRKRHVREPGRRRLARGERGALPCASGEALRAAGMGAFDRRPRVRREDLRVPEEPAADEACGLLRRPAALCL